MNLELYQKLDLLISQGRTGNAKQLSDKLGVSERTVKHMVTELREKCNAPVEFCKKMSTYHYITEGRCHFVYYPCLKQQLLNTLYTSLADTIVKTLPALSIVCFAISDMAEFSLDFL